MIKRNIILIMWISLVLFISDNVLADEYMANLAQMPVHAVSKYEGIQVELAKAIEKITGNKITIELYPS